MLKRHRLKKKADHPLEDNESTKLQSKEFKYITLILNQETVASINHIIELIRQANAEKQYIQEVNFESILPFNEKRKNQKKQMEQKL